MRVNKDGLGIMIKKIAKFHVKYSILNIMADVKGTMRRGCNNAESVPNERHWDTNQQGHTDMTGVLKRVLQ